MIKAVIGSGQIGGYLIPPEHTEHLIPYEIYLKEKQKRDILEALKTDAQSIIKPTQKQGGFLGTLSASIGIPVLLKAVTGRGLQVDRSGMSSRPVYAPKTTGASVIPVEPPPLLGTWENPVGMGKKNSKRTGTSSKKKNSPFNAIPLMGDILK